MFDAKSPGGYVVIGIGLDVFTGAEAVVVHGDGLSGAMHIKQGTTMGKAVPLSAVLRIEKNTVVAPYICKACVKVLPYIVVVGLVVSSVSVCRRVSLLLNVGHKVIKIAIKGITH